MMKENRIAWIGVGIALVILGALVANNWWVHDFLQNPWDLYSAQYTQTSRTILHVVSAVVLLAAAWFSSRRVTLVAVLAAAVLALNYVALTRFFLHPRGAVYVLHGGLGAEDPIPGLTRRWQDPFVCFESIGRTEHAVLIDDRVVYQFALPLPVDWEEFDHAPYEHVCPGG